MNFVHPHDKKDLEKKSNHYISDNGDEFPIINNIPRFIDSSNYAKSFGLQWKKFSKTQLDSYTKTNISKKRLERLLEETSQ